MISGGFSYFVDGVHVCASPFFKIGTNMISGGLFHFANSAHLKHPQVSYRRNLYVTFVNASLNLHIHKCTLMLCYVKILHLTARIIRTDHVYAY